MPGKRYTILTATGGVTGTFGDMTQNMPFVDLGLAYDPNAVYLDISRNAADFASVAMTVNQKAVALAIEALGAGNTVYDALVMQAGEQDARRAFDLLSGEAYASTKTALINDSVILRNAVQDRIGQAFGNVTNSQVSSLMPTHGVKPVTAPLAAMWGQVIGSWSETDADDNAGKLKQSTGGFVAGYDAEIAENWRLGGLAGYSRTSFDISDRKLLR